MTTKSNWQIVGASVPGTAHQKNEVLCQDAYGYRRLPGDVLLIAVADGAGTVERAAEGATLAITQVMDSVEIALNKRRPDTKARWRALLVKAFKQARRAVVQLANAEDVPPGLFATTLTCAIAVDRWLAVAQIGDGVAVAKAEDGHLFTTVAPQRGEYANETFLLTMEEAQQALETRVYRQPVQALVVMTDGLIRLAMNIAENIPHPPFFEPFLTFTTQITDEIEAQAQLTTFLASERVCARTDDDKTLVIAVRNEQ